MVANAHQQIAMPTVVPALVRCWDFYYIPSTSVLVSSIPARIAL